VWRLSHAESVLLLATFFAGVCVSGGQPGEPATEMRREYERRGMPFCPGVVPASVVTAETVWRELDIAS